MHFYILPLTFRKGYIIIPLCEGAQETAHVLSLGANGLLGSENGHQTHKILILKQIGLVIEQAEICLWP